MHLRRGIGVCDMSIDKSLLPEINDLITNKLSVYPENTRDLAIQAIRLSETYPEASVAEQLQTVIKKMCRENGNAS